MDSFEEHIDSLYDFRTMTRYLHGLVIFVSQIGWEIASFRWTR